MDGFRAYPVIGNVHRIADYGHVDSYLIRPDQKSNISLIGMAACGKSTIGVLLAKSLNMMFIDTDLLIQQKYGKLLSEILEAHGIDEFNRREAGIIGSLDCVNTCIATGGSVINSAAAMERLRNISAVIFIDIPYPVIEQRIMDIKSRGVVIEKDKTLLELYNERRPFYQKYADITVSADNKSIEETLEEIIKFFR